MRYLFLAFLLLTFPLHVKAENIVCFGDSNTEGYGVRPEYSWCSLLNGTNLGIGGNSSREGLARLSQVLELKPKTVIIMFGTGDAYDPDGDGVPRIPLTEYMSNMRRIARSLKKKRVRVVLQSPLCTASQQFNALLKPYVIESRKIAKRLKLPLVENYTDCTEAAMEGKDYFTDYAHISEYAHFQLYKKLRKVLKFIKR